MIRRLPTGRSGITLTEILIAILILGVGIASLATLFPLGLLRLRDARRLSRSGYLVESAAADLGTRDLLNKQSFLNVFYSPWYNLGGTPYDPWVRDTGTYANLTNGAVRTVGSGLVVAYDPLWWYQAFITNNTYNPNGWQIDGTFGTTPEARFASGIGFLRDDPNPGNTDPSLNAVPSGHGLQRLTNFNPNLTTLNTVPEIFVSPEDIVWQGNDGANGTGASPVIPDLSISQTTPLSVTYDWQFTWMFTGQQSDATDGTIFNGNIVIFENRPLAIDQVVTPFGGAGTVPVVAGEPVVEAIFGYGGTLTNASTGSTVGYAASAKRVVLLRWPVTMPDPEVRVGNWIADVTYERTAANDLQRSYNDPIGNSAGPIYPYQRCNWYQVVKRTTPGPGVAFPEDPVAYRSMTVWVGSDLSAQTLLRGPNGANPPRPYHINAALISPYVVNVFPRTVYTR